MSSHPVGRVFGVAAMVAGAIAAGLDVGFAGAATAVRDAAEHTTLIVGVLGIVIPAITTVLVTLLKRDGARRGESLQRMEATLTTVVGSLAALNGKVDEHHEAVVKEGRTFDVRLTALEAFRHEASRRGEFLEQQFTAQQGDNR